MNCSKDHMNPHYHYFLKRAHLGNLGLNSINTYQSENKVLQKIAAKIIDYCPALRANFNKIIIDLQLDNRPLVEANDFLRQQ